MDGEKLSLVDRNDQNTAPRTPEAPGSRPAREWRPEEQAATLNEHEAIKERERVVLQNEAREKERAARAPLAGKFYELSLADAAKDGLPAPLVDGTNAVDAKAVAQNAHAVNSPSIGNPTSAKSSDAPTNVVAQADADGGKPAPVKPKPGEDPMLEETQHILNDYISLLAKTGWPMCGNL